MKQINNIVGFTLVELIVGITISMLLMVSVGVFMSGGMQNIFLQQKVFENAGDFVEFNATFIETLSDIDTGFPLNQTPNGIIFKRDTYFGNGGFAYIGVSSASEYYCTTGETPVENITDHLFIQNFIPYFESGETNIDDIFTASVGNYISHAKRHIITDTSDPENILIGKETFGNALGKVGTGTFLNNPTGLAESGSILFVSDTLNNRILAYDSDDNSIVELLNEQDGLKEPTGLFYDDANTTLYIANSGAGEILSYSSSQLTDYPDTTLVLNQTNISKFNIEVFNDEIKQDIGLDKTNFNITSNSTENYYRNSANDTGEYIFTNYQGIESAWTSCAIGSTRYNGGNPQKCTAPDIGRIGPVQQNIDEIEIIGSNSLPVSGNYYIALELFDNLGSSVYQEYFSYFTQGDGNLLTKDDNTLSVVDTTNTYEYPTGIVGTDMETDVLDFDIGATTDYSFNEIYDVVLETPIENFDINIELNGATPELLTLSGSYYKSYDCNNPDNNITREFIWKKNLK